MVHLLWVRGLTTSSWIVYDYTTGGYMDLQSIYLLYMQCIYISVQYTYMYIYMYKQYTYISVQYI